jgi:hypothetical protein
MRRVGSEYIAEVKDSSKKTRLMKFVFSNSESYIIEAGEYYFRFYKNGSQIVKTLGDTSAWVTVTSYSVGDFVQESSTIYYCIVAHTSGTFATDLAAGKWVAQSIYELPTPFTQAELFDLQFVQINDLVYITSLISSPQLLTRLGDNSWTIEDFGFFGGPYLDDNETATTITPSATTGAITLTASTSIFTANHVGSYWKVGGTTGTPTKQGYVLITGYTSGTVVNATVESTLSGTGATTEWAEGAWSDERGYPACCALHDGRLWLGRTTYEPNGLWASQPFKYDNFTPPVDGEDDGAINLKLASGGSNEIKWIASGQALGVGTYSTEFTITADGGIITPTDAIALARTNFGSERLQPEAIGSFIYFIQRNAEKIREYYYFFDNDTYKAADMTVFSEHITNSGITDTAFQQNPDSVLWATKDNGDMVAFTRETDQQVQAWALMSTDGSYESVEVIPSTNTWDETWTVANRTIDGNTKRYIERFNNPLTADRLEDCTYSDSYLTLNQYNQTTGLTLTLSATTGDITVTSSGAIFASGDVGQRIRAIDSDNNVVGQCVITAYNSSTSVDATVSTNYDFDGTSYGGNLWGISVNDISGLDHLEAEDVSILADGAVQTSKTVSSGEITLELDAWEVVIGLEYQSYIKTLPIEGGSQTGTAQAKRKRIYQLGLRVYDTIGISIGSSLTDLKDVDLRDPRTNLGEPSPLFTGIVPNNRFSQRWTWEDSIVIEQSNPLPMNILNIMPLIQEVDR